jgi:hypothetical protein
MYTATMEKLYIKFNITESHSICSSTVRNDALFEDFTILSEIPGKTCDESTFSFNARFLHGEIAR